MSNEIVQLIVTAASSLLSGALGGYIATRVSRDQRSHERELEDDKRHIANMERLHATISDLANKSNNLMFQMVGKHGYGVAINPELLGGKISFDELNMLVDYYAPSLRDEADKMQKGFNVIFEALAKTILKQNQSSDFKAEALEATVKGNLEIAGAATIAKKKLAKMMKDRMPPKFATGYIVD